MKFIFKIYHVHSSAALLYKFLGKRWVQDNDTHQVLGNIKHMLNLVEMHQTRNSGRDFQKFNKRTPTISPVLLKPKKQSTIDSLRNITEKSRWNYSKQHDGSISRIDKRDGSSFDSESRFCFRTPDKSKSFRAKVLHPKVVNGMRQPAVSNRFENLQKASDVIENCVSEFSEKSSSPAVLGERNPAATSHSAPVTLFKSWKHPCSQFPEGPFTRTSRSGNILQASDSTLNSQNDNHFPDHGPDCKSSAEEVSTSLEKITTIKKAWNLAWWATWRPQLHYPTEGR
eukprot:gnl/MRDRNA2_/MRDRNA2_243468_c0_seq1.p1 gnl/MRDRNA2_/MRDRNA2_243468_c0~~gnl/MRDRNA2_/MRDRNA2_243468_c0_seq1.p1  ORF type:complete len:284 (-),score=41.33 gnl/MRDRNA2_/MRDRNA2_243468_c0_seq1:300-1151(-)